MASWGPGTPIASLILDTLLHLLAAGSLRFGGASIAWTLLWPLELFSPQWVATQSPWGQRVHHGGILFLPAGSDCSADFLTPGWHLPCACCLPAPGQVVWPHCSEEKRVQREPARGAGCAGEGSPPAPTGPSGVPGRAIGCTQGSGLCFFVKEAMHRGALH